MKSLAISRYTVYDYLSYARDGKGTTDECKEERRLPLSQGRIPGRLRISHGLRPNGELREIVAEIEEPHGTSWLHVQARGIEGGRVKQGWCDERPVAPKCISGEKFRLSSIKFKVRR